MRQKILVVSLILLMLAAVAAETHGTTIVLRGEASVAPAVVRLGDVSMITDPESQEQAEKLRSVTVCSAPPPGEVHMLNPNTIVSALRRSGLELSRLQLAGHGQVLIKREHDLVSVQELRRAFSEHVSGRTGWQQDSFLVRPPKNLHATPVPIGDRIVIAETFPKEDFCGSVLAYFHIVVDAEPYRTLAHRFTVERYVEALVAARKIPRGESVSASDVEIKKVEQSRIHEDALTSAEQAVGLLAVRTIYPGKILSRNLLTVTPVVRKGESAPLVCEGNGFHIVTNGRVLEDGCADEVVRVRLPNRKIVKATVLESKTLQLVRRGERNE